MSKPTLSDLDAHRGTTGRHRTASNSRRNWLPVLVIFALGVVFTLWVQLIVKIVESHNTGTTNFATSAPGEWDDAPLAMVDPTPVKPRIIVPLPTQVTPPPATEDYPTIPPAVEPTETTATEPTTQVGDTIVFCDIVDEYYGMWNIQTDKGVFSITMEQAKNMKFSNRYDVTLQYTPSPVGNIVGTPGLVGKATPEQLAQCPSVGDGGF